MIRIKRGTISLKRRRSVLKKTKGYRWGRKNKERAAKEAIYHAGNHAFQHRRKKKGEFRKLWTIRINAILRKNNLSYSTFINKLKNDKILLNRKVMGDMARDKEKIMQRVIDLQK